MLITGQLLLMY